MSVLSLPLRVAGLLALASAPLPARATQPPPPPPPVIEAPEVTITATRSERNVLDVPGNVTVIDREAIDRSGARSVPDLLRREAGLFVTNDTSNPFGAKVEARGFQNGGGNGCHTLVLIDGRRVNQPDTSCPDWSFVSLDEVERVEVIRGPVSAAYGDNGIGGVIHILSRHGRAEPGLRAFVRGRTGSYDTDGGSLWLEGGEGPVGVTAFVEDDTTDAYRERADFARRASQLGLRLGLGEIGALELKGGYTNVRRKQPGDLSEIEWDDDPRQVEPDTGANSDEERSRTLEARLELRPHEAVVVELRPWHQRDSQRTALDDPAFDFDTDADVDTLGLNAQATWSHTLLGRSGQLLVGSDLLQEDVDADSVFVDPFFGPFPSADRTRRKLLGVFVNEELWLREDLQLSLGLRRDRANTRGEDEISGSEFDETDRVWSPRAALTWRVAEPASLYLSWARGFRFPNRAEQFGFFGFTPGLEPEESESFEIGAKLRRPGLALNVAVYHMNVSDEIFFDPDLDTAFPDQFPANQNFDRVRHRGAELSGSWQPVRWLELFASYTYEDVVIERYEIDPTLEGSRMPITPEHRGNVGGTVFLPWGFEVGGAMNYVGARALGNDLANAEDELPRYKTYDARIGWMRKLSEHVVLALDVTGTNLTNRRYAEFGAVSTFAPFEVGFFPSPDRHYVASARLELRR